MFMNLVVKPAPSLLLGTYPQRRPKPSGAFAPLESKVERLLWRGRFRKSRQRDALRRLREPGHSTAPMGKVLLAWEESASERIGDEVIAAADALQNNRALVELANATQSEQAAHLAALALAGTGVPVHLVYDAEKPLGTKMLLATCKRLGLSLANISDDQTSEQRREAYRADIVLINFQQLMFDYLLDQRLLDYHKGAIRGRLQQRILGNKGPLLPGLACAIVVDARAVLIEQAGQPMALSDSSVDAEAHTLSFYTEAIQCATLLTQGQDYLWKESGRIPVLLESGEQRLRELTKELGPLWYGVSRTRSAVSAALVVLQMKETCDYAIVDGRAVIELAPEFYAALDGLTKSDYKQLILAKHNLPGASTGPTISRRLSLQHFFPRYVHLGAAGWLLQPRRKELEEVYQLFSVPPLVQKQEFKPELRLCRSTQERYCVAAESLKHCIDEQHNILLLHNHTVALETMHSALDQQLASVLLRQGSMGDMASVGGLFLSLTYEEVLSRREASDQSGAFQTVVLMDTPTNMLEELLICDYLCTSGKIILLASPDEEAFDGCSNIDKALMPFSPYIYRQLRTKIDSGDEQLRAQVAAHDAYVRQTLAFSGDID
jgi:SecA-like ATPase subunit of protein translocation complex